MEVGVPWLFRSPSQMEREVRVAVDPSAVAASILNNNYDEWD